MRTLLLCLGLFISTPFFGGKTQTNPPETIYTNPIKVQGPNKGIVTVQIKEKNLIIKIPLEVTCGIHL